MKPKTIGECAQRHGLNWGQISSRIKAINCLADLKYIAFYVPGGGDIYRRVDRSRRLLKRIEANQARLSVWAGSTDRSEDWLDVARVMYFSVKVQKEELERSIEVLERYIESMEGM